MSENKGEPIFGLDKIPDSDLLKASQKELGEWKSYAEELEDEVKELKRKLESIHIDTLSKEERKAVAAEYKKNEMYRNILRLNKDLEKRNKALKATNDELIYKLNMALGVIKE